MLRLSFAKTEILVIDGEKQVVERAVRVTTEPQSAHVVVMAMIAQGWEYTYTLVEKTDDK